MSENSGANRTSKDADQSPERIDDPQAGLARLREALRRILTVPKEAITNSPEHARDEP